MKLLSTAKITDKGRIPLNREVLSALTAQVGEYVQIYSDGERICIAKVTPPEGSS